MTKRVLIIFWIITFGISQKLYKAEQKDGVLLTNLPRKEKLVIFKPPAQIKENVCRFDSIISEAADQYRIDTELIKLIIQCESGFNPHARSPRGAIGLMQLMPETAKHLGVKNSFDPKENIFGGVKFLRYLLNLFNGDLELALAAYHAGPKIVLTLRRVPAIPETRSYVDFITARYAPQDRRTRIYTYLTEDGTMFFTNLPR